MLLHGVVFIFAKRQQAVADLRETPNSIGQLYIVFYSPNCSVFYKNAPIEKNKMLCSIRTSELLDLTRPGQKHMMRLPFSGARMTMRVTVFDPQIEVYQGAGRAASFP